MIVDDESDVGDVLAKGLRLSGFEVDIICNPLDALHNFKAGKYGLAILDIKMPEMDGFDLFERLSRVDNRLKVCFLTAFDADYVRAFEKRFPNLPRRCFITKPIGLSELVKAVENELER